MCDVGGEAVVDMTGVVDAADLRGTQISRPRTRGLNCSSTAPEFGSELAPGLLLNSLLKLAPEVAPELAPELDSGSGSVPRMERGLSPGPMVGVRWRVVGS